MLDAMLVCCFKGLDEVKATISKCPGLFSVYGLWAGGVYVIGLLHDNSGS